jgi:hypothetical protein
MIPAPFNSKRPGMGTGALLCGRLFGWNDLEREAKLEVDSAVTCTGSVAATGTSAETPGRRRGDSKQG